MTRNEIGFAVAMAIAIGATAAHAASANGATLGQCAEADRYTIETGDTLHSIGAAHGLDVATLLTYNEAIADPDVIHAGDQLCLGATTMRMLVLAEPVTEREGADGCTGGPEPGAIALRDAMIAAYPTLGDGGIYNCRTARGGHAHSTHSEGRAIDLMLGDCHALTDDERQAIAITAELPGVQRVAACDHEWLPDTGWRLASAQLASWHGFTSDGSSPLGPPHIHTELTRDAAAWLTAQDFTNTIAGVKP